MRVQIKFLKILLCDMLSQQVDNVKFEVNLRLPSLKNYNFWKCVIWGTGQEFFYFVKKYVPFSRYSSFCIFNIPWFTKYVTSWWVSVRKTGCIFEYIFWTTTQPQVTKLGQLMDINKSNNFQELFKQFGGLGLSSRSFSI